MRCVGLGWLLGGGQDRDGPLAVEGKLLGGHMPAGWKWGPGTADESFEGQQGCGSRLAPIFTKRIDPQLGHAYS